MTTVQELKNVGSKEAEISVSISYKIIELFSAGLYSSPNKAIEELVSNSYDAMGKNVHVIVPEDLQAQSALIWIIDDGLSMDKDGLIDLWKLAQSRKREPGRESKDRPPIGKFGIGKLATYVLARELTYICKAHGQYRAVTMDYTDIDQNSSTEEKLFLPLRILTEAEAQELLGPIIHRDDEATRALPLFGPKSSESWTVAVMGSLTGLAHRLSPGRLRWVLSSALPLSPQFNMFLNGVRVVSTREALKPLSSWEIGNNDAIAKSLEYETHSEPFSVDIPGAGRIRGGVSLFEDPLTGGKAENFGRSHGIFVIVRGRLVNLDDALFGLVPLSFGAFSRFRMEVYADDLDDVLRSTREAVLETEGVKRLQEYILAKFNEARSFWTNFTKVKDYEGLVSTRVGSVPQSLSRLPLINAVRSVLNGTIPSLFLTHIPRNLDAAAQAALLQHLEEDELLIKDVEMDVLDQEQGLALFDVVRGVVRVNLLHPFYANYSDNFTNTEPFELIALTEVLTEAYLYDEGLSSDSVLNILKRRDRFLRELVFSRQLAAPLVADYLQNSLANATGLEKSVAAGLSSIGFEVSPIGGNGEPDGVAHARMGIRDLSTGIRADYSITYDTKSTAKDRIKANTAGSGGKVRHRVDYKADYSLIIAPGFEGSDSEDSAVVKEAHLHSITMMTVADFIRLVLLAATRQLGFQKLQDLFKTCRGPKDASEWIDKMLKEDVIEGPLPEILETAWRLQAELPNSVKFSAISAVMQFSQTGDGKPVYSDTEIRDWLQSVRRLAGGYITIIEDVVFLEVTPDRILKEIRYQTKKLPEQFLTRTMLSNLAQNSDQD